MGYLQVLLLLLLELLFDIVLKALADSVDLLLLWWHALDPACVVPDDVLVQNLRDGYDLLIDTVHLEVLVHTQVNLDLFDGVHPLVQLVLSFVDFSESTLANNTDLLE